MKSRVQNKETRFFFLPRQSNFATFVAKLRKNEGNAKEKRAFSLHFRVASKCFQESCSKATFTQISDTSSP